MAAGARGWLAGGLCGQVIRSGIGEWPATSRDHRRGSVVMFLSWADVLRFVARGCGDGHLERNEAAYRRCTVAARQLGAAHADRARVDEAARELVRRATGRPAARRREVLF